MIRKAEPSDLAFVHKLYMHPKVNPWLLYENMNIDEFTPVFNDLVERGVKYIFEADGQPAGMFKLIRLEHRTDHVAYLGGLAIDPQFAGKGLGRKLMAEIIDLGKQMGLLRIELSASVENQKAQELYLKAGFEREGILRKYSHLQTENRYMDEVLMSFLY